jgi:hypothetical protein
MRLDLGQPAVARIRAMPEEVVLAVRFTKASLRHEPEADELREEVLRRFGKRGLVSLAFAMTAARLYPSRGSGACQFGQAVVGNVTTQPGGGGGEENGGQAHATNDPRAPGLARQVPRGNIASRHLSSAMHDENNVARRSTPDVWVIVEA